MSAVRVMIVDDDAMIRRTLSSALARAGFDVSTAADGASALKLAEVARPDIAVLDFNMPQGGVDTVRKLKTTHGDAMFVAVLTGEDSDVTHATCFEAGADAVLLKPISPIELRRRLSAAASALKPLSIAS
jgi:two-component system, OmpR family, response regulator MprA